MTKNYVIITGAYGGLGRALSEKYASEGYGLILLDREKEKLKSLQSELKQKTDVEYLVCDISDWEECKKAYNEIKKRKLTCKILINNAGITYIKKLDEEYDISRYQQVIKTNLNGAVYLTKLFLDVLIENNGSLINISSVIGYAPVIGRTAYAASKFGMQGFFSVLQAEQNDKLHILMVYPTFIATEIRKNVKGDKTVNEVLTAEEAAQLIYNAFIKKKENVYIGKTAKLTYYLYKYFPNLYVNLMRKKTGNID